MIGLLFQLSIVHLAGMFREMIRSFESELSSLTAGYIAEERCMLFVLTTPMTLQIRFTTKSMVALGAVPWARMSFGVFAKARVLAL
jgi:hypothetical protein